MGGGLNRLLYFPNINDYIQLLREH
jgi:hypothetical protein